MDQENATGERPGATPSSAGLIVVGLIAVAALAIAVYGTFFRSPAAASGSPAAASSFDLEKRLVALEQGLANREPKSAASAARETVAGITTSAVSHENMGAGRFEVVANAALKGRLGRLVVEFPQANDLKARTEAFKAGEAKGLRTEFGNLAVEMTAGAYDLNISGAVVANVPIQSGHDTRVHVGVLRLNASGNTRFELFAPGEKKSLGVYFGQTDVGLPVGGLEVEVNGQRERVTITAGALTEF